MSDGYKVIEVDGRRYQYDPDFDCFRRIDEHAESKYGWIVVTVCVAIVAFLVEYFYR